jgi:hypothetical protein
LEHELLLTRGELALVGLGPNPKDTVITTSAPCQTSCARNEGCDSFCDEVSCSIQAKHRLIRAQAEHPGELFLSLENLTLRGGNDRTLGGAGPAGGALLSVGAVVDLERVAVLDNKAQGRGAGLAALDSWVRLSECVVRHNLSEQVGCGLSGRAGGMTSFGGGAYFENSEVLIERSSFIHNLAADGGGLAAVGDGTLQVQNSTFSDNHALGRGGGMLSAVATSLEFCTFAYNVAGQDPLAPVTKGGGMCLESGGSLRAFGNVFSDNLLGDAGEQSPDVGVVDTGAVEAAGLNLISMGGEDLDELGAAGDPLIGAPGQPLSARFSYLDDGDRLSAVFPFSTPSTIAALAHGLQLTSPALDAYRPHRNSGPACPRSDQKGAERNEPCDLGAVEQQATQR